MSSETYRYYCLDGAGHLHEAEWFAAESDADAVAQVRSWHPDGKCEIWQAKRLVASVSPPLGRATGARRITSPPAMGDLRG